MSLNKTLIDWVKNPDGTQGYTLNSKTGCLNHTPEGLCLGGMFPCYAYNLANGRLKRRYWLNENLAPTPRDLVNYNLDPFYPRWWPERLRDIPHDWTTLAGRQHVKPKGIFLDDMSDWMGDYWPEEWTEQELQMMRDCSQHRIYTLTKQPRNLIKFSPFPGNCWVGVTATSHQMFVEACLLLSDIKASVKYISIEPLLSWGAYPADETTIEQWAKGLSLYGINQVIIGACTGTYPEMVHLSRQTRQEQDFDSIKQFGNKWTLQPKVEWLEEIVRAADQAGVKVFLKNNLKPLLETLDITGTSFGRLTSLTVEAIKDTQGLPRQRGWYELRQELPSGQ